MSKVLKSIILVILILCMGFVNVYSDPSAPPPPPAVTKVFYYSIDEFMGCGPIYADTITYCPNLLTKETVVSKAGKIISDTSVTVCGKNNNEQVTETLNDSWVCPTGKAITQLHEAGTLDPQFNSISLSSYFARDQAFIPIFRSETNTDVYFNAFIPACVNRIPMMNFNLTLLDQGSASVSSKVGLYAKHETLSYDANPMGGLLENFYIPTQKKFRDNSNLVSDLKTYRMWSFRQRFVEGLQRIIDEKDLQLPQANLNVDELDSSRPNDFEDIYFSRDFMMGAYKVDNQNSAPVGEDLEQILSSICNFDVHDLNLNYIDDERDLKDALRNDAEKSEIINVLNRDRDICSLDSASSIIDIDYIKKLKGTDTSTVTKTLNIDLNDLNVYWADDALDFNQYANYFWMLYSINNELKAESYLSSSNPREEIFDINYINLNTESRNLVLNVNDLGIYGVDNSLQLRDYINSHSNSYISSILVDKNYLSNKELIKNINWMNILNDDELSFNFDIYTTIVNMNVDVYSIIDYNSLVSVELTLLHQTSSDTSWNWRSLESLTLTQLARCLYSWDECLFNARSEPDVSWEMQEVADLGYGPRMDSLAYQWSESQLQSDYNLTYGYHFDGARGDNIVNTPITVYRSCNENDSWISEEKYYACYNQTIYKCYYGLDADEIKYNLVKPAYFEDVIAMNLGHGMVCVNRTTGPEWKEVNCYDETSVLS